MGFFNLFKKPALLQDDFFGTLKFIDFKDASKSYFEGRGYFKPSNGEIGYLIMADKEGPEEKQKLFYKNLQTEFTEIEKKVKPLIEDEFRNWKVNFEINDFNEEFKVVSLSIPRFNAEPIIWDIAFTTIHDLNHQITIDFTDYNPTGILIDG